MTKSISHWLEFHRTLWGEPFVIPFKVQSNDMTLKLSFLEFQVRLIASVPGYHSGPSLRKWGHMKLRTILQECTFGKEFQKSPLIYQVSVSVFFEFHSAPRILSPDVSISGLHYQISSTSVPSIASCSSPP